MSPTKPRAAAAAKDAPPEAAATESAAPASRRLTDEQMFAVLKLIRGADSVELISGEAAVSASTHPVVVRAASGRISASDAQFTVRCDGAQVRVTDDVILEARLV